MQSPVSVRQTARIAAMLWTGIVAGAAPVFAQGAAAPPPMTAPADPPIIAPEGKRPVAIEEAIQVAFQNHARISIAEESVEQSRQRVRQARTGTLPSLGASLGYRGTGTSNLGGAFGSRPTQTVIGPTGPVRVPVDTDTATFDRGLQPRVALNYNIYDGGLTKYSVRQARANVEGTQANLNAVRNNLSFEVTTNYLVQLRSERLLELRRQQERLAAEQLRSVEAQIRVGRAAEADRALVLSELRNRQVDRILAENDVRVAANALRNSMGLPVGQQLQLVELNQEVQALSPLPLLQEAARQRRPEVVQAEAQTRAAQASVSIARIGRKPRLDTQFAFNVSPNNAFNRSDWAIAAAISMPLWDAGLTHAREQEAKSTVQSASANLEQVKRDVEAEVVEAHLNLVSSRERLDAAKLAVEAASVNLQQTQARYEQGIGGIDVVDLITAQVQFATASNNAINALYDVHLAQAQLNRAVGR